MELAHSSEGYPMPASSYSGWGGHFDLEAGSQAKASLRHVIDDSGFGHAFRDTADDSLRLARIPAPVEFRLQSAVCIARIWIAPPWKLWRRLPAQAYERK